MTVLAFDTSSSPGSVAVGKGGSEVLARRFLPDRRTHASSLIPAVLEALLEAGCDRRDLEAVVVGAGPGSFTGLRVGAATAKGLVRGLGVPLRAVSSLAAGAVTAGLVVPGLDPPSLDLAAPDRPRYVLFDARGERVYGACYRVRLDGVETLVPPHAGGLAAVLEDRAPPESLFCGSGARRHASRIEEAGYGVLPPPAGTPSADALLHVAEWDPEGTAVASPSRWEPEYLREWKPGWER